MEVGGMQLVPSWKSGVLKKLGGMGGKAMQSRWFELRGNEMVYYTEQPKGTIDLGRPVTITEDDDNQTWTIHGQHLAHSYTLSAPDPATRAAWLKQIRRSMTGPRRGETEQRIHTLECEREALIATSEQLGHEVHSREETIKQLTDTNSNLFRSTEDLSEKLENEKHEHRTTNTSLNDKTAAVAALTNTVDAQKAQISKMQAALQTAKTKSDTMAAKAAKFDASYATLQEQLEALTNSMQEDNDRAAARLRTSEAEAASQLETEQERFFAELQAAKALAATKDKETMRLVQEVKDQNTTLSALEGEVRRKADHINTLEAQLDHQKESASKAIKSIEEEARAKARQSCLQQPLVLAVKEEEPVGALYSVLAEEGVAVLGANGECVARLPRDTAAEGTAKGGVLSITAPCTGHIREFEGLVEKAAKWDPLPAADMEEGQSASIAVVKHDHIAGWVEGRVLSLSDTGYTAYVNNNRVASVFGLARCKVSVRKTELRERAPKWALYDAPDSSRTASSSAYDHGPGFGCHRGRLDSTFAWVAAEEDTEPWYQIDTGVRQAVGGVVVGGYWDLFEAYLTQLEVHISKDNNKWAAHSLHDVDLSEGKVDTIKFDEYVVSRYIRVVPKVWYGAAPAMKMGVLVDNSEKQEEFGGEAYAHLKHNKWMRDAKTDLALLEIEERQKELVAMHAELDKGRSGLDADMNDFMRTKAKLAEANADLTRNIYTLKEKGTMTVRRTVLLDPEELLEGVELAGIEVASAVSGPLEVDMKIVSVKGTDVFTENEVRSIVADEARTTPNQPVPLIVTYENETAFVQNLKEEISLLRDEIKRQHTSINHLEGKAKRALASQHSDEVVF